MGDNELGGWAIFCGMVVLIVLIVNIRGCSNDVIATCLANGGVYTVNSGVCQLPAEVRK